MHGVQRMRCLEDENTPQLLFHLWQGAGGATTAATLARRALRGLLWRIQQRLGGGKRREEAHKFCVRQSGRSEQLSWSVL